MASEEPVTQWLDQLKAGDHAAAQKLWERYFQRLVSMARRKLQDQPRRAADEEDVALSAFASFCKGAELGRFPKIQDREDLWRLLITMTVRKARHLVRDEHRQKRGGGDVLGESAFLSPEGSSDVGPGIDQVVGQEPTPAFAAQVAEECRRLLGNLGDAELRSIALWKMEGDTTDEIASKLGCAPATVERRLRLIRQRWEKEGGP